MLRSRFAAVAALAFGVIGLAASITSLVDYVGGAPTFCAESGCATVRASEWAHPLGVPMPVLGLAFYAVAIGLCFVARPRLRAVVAGLGAAWAIFLIVLQGTVIHAWCKLCMIADPAALGYALAVALGAKTVRASGRPIAVGIAGLGAAIGALALWTRGPAPEPVARAGEPLPAFVQRAQKAGAKTIVEVMDFECPFCRRLQTQLAPAVAQARVPVHLVRKMVPLPMHAGAFPAALAYCCADAQGKGDEMAAALFAADPKDLTTAGCEAIAEKVGCDLERYRRDQLLALGRVATDLLDARGAGIRSLPTTFIGAEKLVGASATTEQLAAMIAR